MSVSNVTEDIVFVALYKVSYPYTFFRKIMNGTLVKEY